MNERNNIMKKILIVGVSLLIVFSCILTSCNFAEFKDEDGVDVTTGTPAEEETTTAVSIPELPQELKILYSSDRSNAFFTSFLDAFCKKNQDRSNISFEKFVYEEGSNVNAPNSGYDVYIYEGSLPEVLPSKGLCIIFDPQSAPSGAGFSIGKKITFTSPVSLSVGESHPILNNAISSEIDIMQITEITAYDGYSQIFSLSEYPVVLASEKSFDSLNTVLFAFSLNYSNFALIVDFPIIMSNIIEYYTSTDAAENLAKKR